MDSIKFDNVELVNATYHLEVAKHLSMPEREIFTSKRGASNGELILSDFFRAKTIIVKGVITADNPAELVQRANDLKKLLASTDTIPTTLKNLDITPPDGNTIRYKAICTKLIFNQEFYNTHHVPYEAEFFVPDGFGYDPNTITVEKTNITTSPYEFYLTITGSIGCLPTITITKTAGTVSKVKFQNLQSNNYIEVENALDDELVIDEKEMTCQVGGSDVDFNGVFPRWYTGENANLIKLITTGSGYTLNLTIEYNPLYL